VGEAFGYVTGATDVVTARRRQIAAGLRKLT